MEEELKRKRRRRGTRSKDRYWNWVLFIHRSFPGTELRSADLAKSTLSH